MPGTTDGFSRVQLCAGKACAGVPRFVGLENRDLESKFIEEHRMAMQSRNGVKVAFPAV